MRTDVAATAIRERINVLTLRIQQLNIGESNLDLLETFADELNVVIQKYERRSGFHMENRDGEKRSHFSSSVLNATQQEAYGSPNQVPRVVSESEDSDSKDDDDDESEYESEYEQETKAKNQSSVPQVPKYKILYKARGTGTIHDTDKRAPFECKSCRGCFHWSYQCPKNRSPVAAALTVTQGDLGRVLANLPQGYVKTTTTM